MNHANDGNRKLDLNKHTHTPIDTHRQAKHTQVLAHILRASGLTAFGERPEITKKLQHD